MSTRVVATPAQAATVAPSELRGSGMAGRALTKSLAGVLVLLAGSFLLRSTALHAPFWIDEGLSVGISSHPLSDIPSVLRQDGSPPLYYLLLGVWMRLFGDGQATTHALSLGFALAAVPAGWWAGRSLFGPRAGWYVAVLAATNPFLTYYAQETRMYSLVSLLAMLVVALFAHVFAFGRRGYRVPAGLALAALAYAHNWGLFLGAATAGCVLVAWLGATDRRAVLHDAAVVYGVTVLLYLPWVPSLLFQAAHTGAPWSERPSLVDVFGPLTSILGGPVVPLGLLMAAGAGLATLATRGPRRESDAHVRGMWMLVLVPAAGLALAWTTSQVSPAWAGRYFAVFAGPMMLLAGVGLSRAGRMGILCLAIVTVLWLHPRTAAVEHKSDARGVAALVAPHVRPGDLVVSVHPEQAPLLRYYFPRGLRYATALGLMPDAGVFDWRDALGRLRAAKPGATLAALVGLMRPGARVVLVLPIIRTARWGAPWTSLVRRRSGQWRRDADHDPQLRRLMAVPHFAHHGPLPRGVRAVIYERR